MTSFTISGIIGAVARDGEVVFKDLAAAIETGAAAIVKALGPAFTTLVSQEVTAAKQFTSDAITMADNALASHQQAIALAVEQAIDAELSLVTKGGSIPFNEFTNHGVDQLVAAAVAAAHNAGLLIKTRLAAPAAPVAAAQAPYSQAAAPQSAN